MQSWLPKVAICTLVTPLVAAQPWDSAVSLQDLDARNALAVSDLDSLYARDAGPEPYDEDSELLSSLSARYSEPEPEPEASYFDDNEVFSLLQARDSTSGRAGARTLTKNAEKRKAEEAKRKALQQEAMMRSILDPEFNKRLREMWNEDSKKSSSRAASAKTKKGGGKVRRRYASA